MTGESLTETVIVALEQRLKRERARRGGKSRLQSLLDFSRRFAEGKLTDASSADHAKIYDHQSLPK